MGLSGDARRAVNRAPAARRGRAVAPRVATARLAGSRSAGGIQSSCPPFGLQSSLRITTSTTMCPARTSVGGQARRRHMHTMRATCCPLLLPRHLTKVDTHLQHTYLGGKHTRDTYMKCQRDIKGRGKHTQGRDDEAWVATVLGLSAAYVGVPNRGATCVRRPTACSTQNAATQAADVRHVAAASWGCGMERASCSR